MKNTTPIILDRLAESLSRCGVVLRRQQLLTVAASAFGYRNDKTFSAADAAGELNAPLAGSAGIDDQGLAVIHDPIAGAMFAMNVEHRKARADRWTVSPYGNLLDLGPIAGTPTTRAEMPVHVACVSHRHGTSFYVDVTEKDLDAQIAEFCDEWWEEARERDEDLPLTTEGMTDAEIIEAYFNAHDDEYVERSTDTIKVPRSVATRYQSVTAEAWVATRIDLESDEPMSWWNGTKGWGDLVDASVYADASGALPEVDDGQSVSWQRMPSSMVDGSAAHPAQEDDDAAEWTRDTTRESAEVGAMVTLEGITVAEGVSFRILNTERRLAPTETSVFRRRVLMQTGGTYDRAAAEAWKDAISAETRNAGLAIEVTDRYARVVFENDGDIGEAPGPEDWVSAVTDLLTPSAGRDRILADFQPEAWINDHAVPVDCDEAKTIDVTYEMLLMGREAAMELDTTDSDHLLEAVRASDRIRTWDGPFTIFVHRSVASSKLFDAGTGGKAVNRVED